MSAPNNYGDDPLNIPNGLHPDWDAAKVEQHLKYLARQRDEAYHAHSVLSDAVDDQWSGYLRARSQIEACWQMFAAPRNQKAGGDSGE